VRAGAPEATDPDLWYAPFVDDWPGVRPPIGGTRSPAAWGLGVAAVGGLACATLATGPLALAGGAVAAVGAWEAAWWARRRARRASQYARARAEATALGRPLVVVGAPDGGVTSGYGCGDVTVDLSGSSCPNTLQADVTQPLPFATDSVVCYVSCVLEYVTGNVQAAIVEIERISGGHVFWVGVEPWTLTSLYVDGAKRTLPARYR